MRDVKATRSDSHIEGKSQNQSETPWWELLLSDRVLGVVSTVVLLIAWEISSRTGILDARIVAPPSMVAVTIYNLLVSGPLVSDILITVWRFLLGMFFGALPGVLIGLTMGLFRPVRAALYPIAVALYNAPKIALFPLILILLGINEQSNILMIALGPFFTMLIAALGAVSNVEQIYKDVAHNFRARPRDLYFLVMLPAIMPTLMDGVRISVGLALLGTIAVEFLVGDSGLGQLIWNSWNILSLKQSLAGLIVASIIGWIAFAIVDFLERRLIPWKSEN